MNAQARQIERQSQNPAAFRWWAPIPIVALLELCKAIRAGDLEKARELAAQLEQLALAAQGKERRGRGWLMRQWGFSDRQARKVAKRIGDAWDRLCGSLEGCASVDAGVFGMAPVEKDCPEKRTKVRTRIPIAGNAGAGVLPRKISTIDGATAKNRKSVAQSPDFSKAKNVPDSVPRARTYSGEHENHAIPPSPPRGVAKVGTVRERRRKPWARELAAAAWASFQGASPPLSAAAAMLRDEAGRTIVPGERFDHWTRRDYCAAFVGLVEAGGWSRLELCPTSSTQGHR